jgi:hypothetical protein
MWLVFARMGDTADKMKMAVAILFMNCLIEIRRAVAEI